MKTKTLLLAFLLLSTKLLAQSESPYKTSWKTDGIAIAGGIGLSTLGLNMIKDKKDLTEADINTLSKEDVFVLDRFSAGYYNEKADDNSYIPFYGSFAAVPVIMLLNKNERNHAGQVMTLFVETMSITGALFSITAGAVERSRPYVYNTGVEMSHRMDSDSQRSFFAGHTAATASATFFAAKVFSDFNPDSKARPYVWAAAAAVPAAVAYMRLRAGQHFLTDNLLGYGIGAGVGILVPHLHKKSNNSGLSMTPFTSDKVHGVSLTYSMR
ncbi:phosphatase PAP2 family protein [Flavihumibacter sp. R14]|nr:phosphatase PAP2 family protein [Flavihumibacter soli]